LMQDAQTQGADLDSVKNTLRLCNVPDEIIDALFKLADSGT